MSDAAGLIDFAQAWSDLGDAIQRQVRDIVDLGEDADANPNAVRAALRTFRALDSEALLYDVIQPLEEWQDARAD